MEKKVLISVLVALLLAIIVWFAETQRKDHVPFA